MRGHSSVPRGVRLRRADEGASELFDGYIESFHTGKDDRSSGPSL
jgi:hypothetical protein